LLLTLVTGFWAIIWFFMELGSHETKPVCTVCGGVMPEEMVARLKLEEWERKERSQALWAQRIKNLDEGPERLATWCFERCERLITWCLTPFVALYKCHKAWARENKD
jgi:hypothetical protein